MMVEMKKKRPSGINSNDFFKQVAINSGISDLTVTRDVFYGIVKTISRELKDKQVVQLPDFGEFTLKVRPARNFMDVNTRQVCVLPPRAIIKFTPTIPLKKYFYEFGKGL